MLALQRLCIVLAPSGQCSPAMKLDEGQSVVSRDGRGWGDLLPLLNLLLQNHCQDRDLQHPERGGEEG